jgi:hypothetical protein
MQQVTRPCSKPCLIVLIHPICSFCLWPLNLPCVLIVCHFYSLAPNNILLQLMCNGYSICHYFQRPINRQFLQKTRLTCCRHRQQNSTLPIRHVRKSGPQGEPIIFKESTRRDNKEQETSETKQLNNLASEECFIKIQRKLQISKRKAKV